MWPNQGPPMGPPGYPGMGPPGYPGMGPLLDLLVFWDNPITPLVQLSLLMQEPQSPMPHSHTVVSILALTIVLIPEPTLVLILALTIALILEPTLVLILELTLVLILEPIKAIKAITKALITSLNTMGVTNWLGYQEV
ncbi:hypothetical protein AALO_G00134390 [Alosa alosa]|uniref:Uncharacterized protein n=1 Tax=Alosa alosa TaxID=278164 RepID=A0AAV6GHK5_9TELE|nr:hypothetical protein AALO_G00134390 [Alosa alosa]